jgi:hypothetical protein
MINKQKQENMNTKTFFEQWKPFPFDKRQESINSLNQAVKTKGEGKWNDKHIQAVRQLIIRMENYQQVSINLHADKLDVAMQKKYGKAIKK